jgi:hypothetical protein
VLQHIHIVVRAAWINRQTVGQWWECGGIVHPAIIHQIRDPYNGARPPFRNPAATAAVQITLKPCVPSRPSCATRPNSQSR